MVFSELFGGFLGFLRVCFLVIDMDLFTKETPRTGSWFFFWPLKPRDGLCRLAGHPIELFFNEAHIGCSPGHQGSDPQPEKEVTFFLGNTGGS